MSRRRRIIPTENDESWPLFSMNDIENPGEAMGYLDWFVLHRWMGLRYDHPYTLREIGEALRVSPQRVHQRKNRALARLRLPENAGLLQKVLEPEKRSDYEPAAEWRPQELTPHWYDCSRHGRTMRHWTSRLLSNLPVSPIFCPTCSCLVTGKTGGRPARYCDAACRQAAHRSRGPHPRDVLSEADFALADEMISAGYAKKIVNMYFFVMRGRPPLFEEEDGYPVEYVYDEKTGEARRSIDAPPPF